MFLRNLMQFKKKKQARTLQDDAELRNETGVLQYCGLYDGCELYDENGDDNGL